MPKAKSMAMGSLAALAVFATGCLGDAVRDLVLKQVESQSADKGGVVASSDAAATQSPAGAPDRLDQPASANGSSSGFDPYDLSAPPAAAAAPTSPRDSIPAAQPRYELDPTNTSPAGVQAGDANYPAPADRPGPPAGGATQGQIRLRTAVALPQSLPSGTAMGFSVEYQFLGTQPEGSQVQYVWVIKPPSGQPWEAKVQLQSQGTLQTFVTQWGPVSGTYEMRIDAVTRYARQAASRPISATYQY